MARGGRPARTPDPCHGCGRDFPEVFPPPRYRIGDVAFCDSCANRRLAELSGFPALPDAPAPETFSGPDGREHLMCYRLFRCPTGILAEVEEYTPAGDPVPHGYKYGVFAEDHDADLRPLVAELRGQASEGIARSFLTTESGRLLLEGDEVEGRLVWDHNRLHTGCPYAVAVDGRLLTWNEFGRVLEAYEGWRFKLTILAPESSSTPAARSDWWEDLDWTQEKGQG